MRARAMAESAAAKSFGFPRAFAPAWWTVLVPWAVWGCSAGTTGAVAPVRVVRPVAPVAPASPPRDDGQPSKGGEGGTAHAAALEELKIGLLAYRTDRQTSMRVLLPDGPHWTRVKFWGVPTLVGFRYGKDHHAVVAAVITHVDPPADGSPLPAGACSKSFEAWAMPWVEAFDVDVQHDAPAAIMWAGQRAGARSRGVVPQIVDVDSVFAKTATALDHESYAGAYATYPAWKGACLVVGIAVPVRDEEERAKAVRDRFAKEILPRVIVVSGEEPKERY